MRMFVLAPMVELAPNFVHPVLLKNMTELYQQCIDPLKIELLSGVNL
jgi:7,8-dihydro-6-hydroxymethylpterin-pyrophosphokinase